MGIIDIRSRSERMGNIGAVRMADTRTGAVESILGVARAAGERARAGRELANGVAGLARDLARAGQIVDAELETRDRRDADDAANAYMADRQAFRSGYANPDGSWTQGHESAAVGKGGAFETPENWMKADEDNRLALAEKHFGGLSERARKMAERRLAGYELGIMNHDRRRASQIDLAHTVATADESLRLSAESAANLAADADMAERAAVWGAWNDALEADMDAKGVTGDAQRREFRRKNAEALVSAALDRRLGEIGAGTDALSPDDAAAAFDGLAQGVKDRGRDGEGYRAFIDGVVAGDGGVLGDWLGDDMKGSDHAALNAAFLERVEKARAAAVHRAEARERETMGELSALSANAIAKGGLDDLENAFDDMKSRAARMPKGSRLETVALQEAKRLDKAADSLAQYQMMNDLVNGEQPPAYGLRHDGTNEITKGDARKERLFPKVYAAFQDQRRKEFNKGFRAAHDQNLLTMDTAMMTYVANGSPQGFYEYLTDAVVNRKITTGDFTRLRDKFNDGWMKGFKGAPGQQSKQSAMAQKMLDAIKDKLGVDMSVAIKTNNSGDPAIRNGAIDWDDKAELPDAKVRRRRTIEKMPGTFDDVNPFWPGTAVTLKEKIEGQQLRKALGMALKLWSSDGMQIGIDPVTGERLKDGKTHTVNAVEDFRALLDRLADEKNILSAADELKRQSAYAVNIGLYATMAGNRRAERMTGSETVSDEQVGKKDDKDK